MNAIHELIVAILLAIGLHNGPAGDFVVTNDYLPQLKICTESCSSSFSLDENTIYIPSISYNNKDDYQKLAEALYIYASILKPELDLPVDQTRTVVRKILEKENYFNSITFEDTQTYRFLSDKKINPNRIEIQSDDKSKKIIAFALDQKNASTFSNTISKLSKYFNL